MNIHHHQEANKGEFQLQSDGQIVAKMSYSKAGEALLIIDHTEVDPNYSGQGFGFALLEKLLDYVRSHALKVIPLCPFAKASIAKNPQFQDLLKT